MKTILLIVKIILLIVGIETGYAEAAEFSCKRVQFSCKRVQSRTCSGYAERSRKCQEIELAHIAECSLKENVKKRCI